MPQALVCALQSSSDEDAIRTAVSIGGNSDTIAAIAGAIAGGIAEALHGLPPDIAQQGWTYLTPEMRRVMTALYGQVGS